MPTRYTLLLAEDDDSLAELIRTELSSPQLTVEHVRSGAAAIDWLQTHTPDLLLLDYHLPDMSTRELLTRLELAGKSPPFIVITGTSDATVAVAMMKEGAQDYLIKDTGFLTELSGTVQRVLGKLETEHRLTTAEHALRQSQHRHLAILNAIPDAIFRINREGHVLDHRPGHQPARALVTRQAHRADLSAILPADVTAQVLAAVPAVLAGEHVAPVEFQVPEVGDGTFEARLVSSGDHEALLLIRDISERARLEQLKMEFIHRAAHELRTPLTTIGMMVDLLQQGGSAAETEQFWDILKTELVRQLILVDELLSAGRLQNSTFDLHLAPVDLADLLSGVVTAIRPQLKSKHIRFHVQVPDGLPPVMGDRLYLHQVAINLLSNAAKFTPDGGTVRLEAAPAGHGFQAFHVADSGLGIPPEELHQVGERFFRGSNAVANEVPGTGIGLYIVKAIVTRHGGRLECDSHLGEGTRMTVILPTVA